MSRNMCCPNCDSEQTTIYDVRHCAQFAKMESENTVIRRRRCKNCGHTFKTEERIMGETEHESD